MRRRPIIADAKDGDTASAPPRPAPHRDQPGRFKPRAAHLQKAIREMTKSGLVDVMLLSASTAERLSITASLREAR